MAENDLVINITGDNTEFNQSLKDVGKETSKLQKNLAKVAKVSGAIFVGLSAIVGLTVKRFAEFDNELRGVRTLLDANAFGAQSLDEGFKQLTEDLKGVATQFPVSIGGLNKALFDTVSAGVSANKAVATVGIAAKLAVAGITDVSVATDGITSALNAYGLSADEAESIAAKFFTAQKRGKTTVAELAGSFGLVASTAAASGVSLNELFAAVSAATAGGIRTNQAFTALNAVLATVTKPTAQAAAEAKRLGIEFNSTALRSKGLSRFLTDLTSAQGFNETSAEKLFGSVEALKVIYALTGEQADDFASTLAELQDTEESLNTFNKAFEIQQASLLNQFKIIQNQVQILAIGIGEVLAPAVVKIITRLNEFLTPLLKNEKLIKNVAIALGVGVVGAGLIFAFSALGLAVIKIPPLLGALNVALIGTTTRVRGLVGATGLGALLIVIPLVAQNIDFLINLFTGPLFATFAFFDVLITGVIGKFKALGETVVLVTRGEFRKATVAAGEALKPIAQIVFEAGKAAGDAFVEGREIGRIKEKQRKAEDLANEKAQGAALVAQEQQLGKDLTAEQRKANEAQLATQLEQARASAESAARVAEEKIRKAQEAAAAGIDNEEQFGFDLLDIDQDIGDSQVQIFDQTTGSLLSSAQDRQSRLLDIERQGFRSRQEAARTGAGGQITLGGIAGRVARGEIRGTISGGSVAGRTSPFKFNPGQIATGSLATIDIRFRGQASKFFTSEQNKEKSLGTSREI